MSLREFSVRSTGPGAAEVIVDGMDVSNAVAALTVEMSARSLPRLILDVHALGSVTALGEVSVAGASVADWLADLDVDAVRTRSLADMPLSADPVRAVVDTLRAMAQREGV